MLLILGLMLFYLPGCGAGGSGVSSPQSGNLRVAVDWPDRDIPEGTAYFTVDLYRVATTTTAVPTTTIVYPETGATIANIPPGQYNLAVYAYDSSTPARKIGYASRIVYVAAGNNEAVDMTINKGPGLWSALLISRQQGWMETGVQPDRVYVTGVVSNPVTLASGTYTLALPDATARNMTDLGPGGEIAAQNYWVGNPAENKGLSQLEGRGNGSCYNYSNTIAPDTETGTYQFNVNGTYRDVEYSQTAPPLANIASPQNGDFLDLDREISVNWTYLGSEYGYLVKAYVFASRDFGGENIYKYCWSNYDLRNLNFNNLEAFSQMVDNLPSANSAVIPAGVFPPGTTSVIIEVNAFNKAWKQIDMELTPNLLVLPYSTYSIVINNRAWNCFKQDPQRTASAWTPGPVSSYQRWSYATGSPVSASPITDTQGIIYTGSENGKLYAVNPDGTFRWAYDTGSPITQAALWSDSPYNRIFVGNQAGGFYALDQNGGLVWNYEAAGALSNSPLLASDGTVIVGTADGKLQSLSSYNGSPVWAYQTGGAVASSPAMDSAGNLYFGSNDGYFYSLNPQGVFRWKYQTGGAVKSTPCINQEQIVVGSDDYRLYSFSSTGALNWTYTANGPIASSPAFDQQGYLYFGTDNGMFYSLFPNGTFNWDYYSGGAVKGAPLTSTQRNVYVGVSTETAAGKLLAFDENGCLLWEKLFEGRLDSSPAMIQEGLVFLGCRDGLLYCLGAMERPPVINYILPSAQGYPGDQVTITGSNFEGEYAPKVVFCNNQEAAVSSWSYNHIVTTVPSEAVSGDIYVERNGLRSNLFYYTVMKP